MSDRECRKIRKSLRPFYSLFAVTIGALLLSSCGGGGSDSATSSMADVENKALVPGAWVGRVPVPGLSAPLSTSYINTDLGVVSNYSFLVVYDLENESAVQSLLKLQGWRIRGKNGNFAQIDVGVSSTSILKNKYQVLQSSGLFKLVNYEHDVVDNAFQSPDPSLDNASQYWNYAAIRAKEAWEILDVEKYKLTSIAVGVVDRMFAETQLGDLSLASVGAPYASTFCSTLNICNDHGYHVSGIIGATGSDGRGHIGIASGSTNHNEVLAYNSNGAAERLVALSSLLNAGARVVNISQGLNIISNITPSPVGFPLIAQAREQALKDSDLLREQLRTIFNERLSRRLPFPDAVYIQASGNAGLIRTGIGNLIPSENQGYFSAFLANRSDSAIDAYVSARVLIVGAFNAERDLDGHVQIPESQAGLEKFILAPGISICSNVRASKSSSNVDCLRSSTGVTGIMSGTSMAAPHVAGVASMILQANSNLSGEEVASIILGTADKKDGTKWKAIEDGYRYLNAEAAVKEALRRKGDANCGALTDLSIENAYNVRQLIVGETYRFGTTLTPGIEPVTGYEWQISEIQGIRETTSASTSISFANLGTYSVTVTPKTKYGLCLSKKQTLQVIVSVGSQGAYQKISADGYFLPSDSMRRGDAPGEWACLRNNSTGLVIETKTDTGPRAVTNFYTNFTSTAVTQNLTAPVPPNQFGTPILVSAAELNAPTNSIGYINYLNNQRLCGRSNWRLPRVSDGPLVSIRPEDAIWFPDVILGSYPTSSGGVVATALGAATWLGDNSVLADWWGAYSFFANPGPTATLQYTVDQFGLLRQRQYTLRAVSGN